ncbi:MAG: HAD family phosphatase [Acutalibacteraceae bacterium]|nr:HAD family phosphatase [Acutalibacteraceae bacterium]
MKGIIFDFNGTLFLDSPYHETAWRKYAKEEFDIDITKDEYYRCIHGSTNPMIYERLFKKPIPAELIGVFGEKKEQIYREQCIKDKDILTFAKGAYELLDYLEKNSIPHAIATSSEINNVNFFKQLFNLEKWFGEGRIIYDDGTVRGKPHPDLYLKAGEKLGVDMKDLIIVEDACAGVRAAKASGAGLVVGICPDGKDKFVGTEYTDLLIEDFTELDFSLFEK